MTIPASSVEWVLGSRSPRRLDLLRLLLPAAPLRVLPPRSADEPGFDDLRDAASIERRLLEIARRKCDDVVSQLREELATTDVALSQGGGNSAASFPVAAAAGGPPRTVVICADTTIIADCDDGSRVALGQPPTDADWKETVRDWFHHYYLGRTHVAASAVRVAVLSGRGGDGRAAEIREVERVVTTRVSFAAEAARWVDWYLDTGEPQDKAGGYAIQGAGALFVSGIEGCLSNVIGLPLRTTADLLVELGVWDGALADRLRA